MKTKLLTFILLTAVLSGCASIRVWQFQRGVKAGRQALRDGREAKTAYKSGFYNGFLLENLRSR